MWCPACPVSLGRLTPLKGEGDVMERTLAEHIGSLEQKLNALSSLFMQENRTHRRNQLESELRAVESALAHYRLAFDLETSLSSRSIATSTKQPNETP